MISGGPVDALASDAATLRAWNELAEQALSPNPFHRPEVVLAAARHLPPAAAASVVTVTADGRMDLAVPFVPGQRLPRLPGRASTVLDHDQSLLGTPLAREASPDLWRAALDGLSAHSPDRWMVMPLIDISIAEVVKEASAARGRKAAILAPRARAFTRRRPEADYLESQISNRSLRGLRQDRRRLAEELGGDVSVVDFLARDGVRDAVSRFIEREAAGWKGETGGALASHPEQERFFRETCHALAQRGCLAVYGLEGADGTVAAVAVDFVDGDGWFTVKTAYDEDLGKRSPGRLLEQDAFRLFHASGRTFMDTCASPHNAGQHRLFGGERQLTTVYVSLDGVRGDLMVVLALRVQQAQHAWRDLRRWWRREGRDLARRYVDDRRTQIRRIFSGKTS